jgi:hypothetical protein
LIPPLSDRAESKIQTDTIQVKEISVRYSVIDREMWLMV